MKGPLTLFHRGGKGLFCSRRASWQPISPRPCTRPWGLSQSGEDRVALNYANAHEQTLSDTNARQERPVRQTCSCNGMVMAGNLSSFQHLSDGMARFQGRQDLK